MAGSYAKNNPHNCPPGITESLERMQIPQASCSLPKSWCWPTTGVPFCTSNVPHRRVDAAPGDPDPYVATLVVFECETPRTQSPIFPDSLRSTFPPPPWPTFPPPLTIVGEHGNPRCPVLLQPWKPGRRDGWRGLLSHGANRQKEDERKFLGVKK